MAKESCHNCVYSCWDMCQVMHGFSSGFASRPMCANHCDAPGRMQPTPLGGICRNYRRKSATPEGDVRRIPLAGGMYAYVDAADYEWLSKYNWHLRGGGYAARYEHGNVIYMHREIMQPPEGTVVDHIDGNKGNNCRFNLRVCTPGENRRNRAKCANKSSRFTGVGYKKDSDKYWARFQFNGQILWLGYHDDEEEAARAYDHKAVECDGPFARVNFPEEWPPERRAQVYAPHRAGLKGEGVKSAKGEEGRRTEGKRVRTEEGKNCRGGKGRQGEGKRPGGKKTAPQARTQRRRTRVTRRTTKSPKR